MIGKLNEVMRKRGLNEEQEERTTKSEPCGYNPTKMSAGDRTMDERTISAEMDTTNCERKLGLSDESMDSKR